MEQRMTALHRSLGSHVVDCKPLCREARSLGARVMHELTATCELFELSSVLGETNLSNTPVRGRVASSDAFSPVERIQPARRLSAAHSLPRQSLVDVDDLTVIHGSPEA